MKFERKKERWLIFLLMVSFLFCFFDKGRAKEEKVLKSEYIRLANPSTHHMDFLPFEMGVARGFYRNEGINLHVLVMKSFLSIAALRTGEVDFVGSLGSSIRAAAQGMPLKLVMVTLDRSAHFLVTRPEIKSIKDLKGKNIGTGQQLGSSSDFAAITILKHYGLDPFKDLTRLAAGSDTTRLSALLAGSLDGAILAPPLNIIARSKGLKEWIDVGKIMKIPSVGVTVIEKRIKENPDQIKRMIRATLKSTLYLKNNKEDVLQFMIKDWGIDRDIVAEFYDSEIEGYSKDGGTSDDAIQAHIQMGRIQGLFKGEIPVSKVADFTLLKEVQRELGLN